MVKGNNSFLRYDLVITGATHAENMRTGIYPTPDRWTPELIVRREDIPSYKDLKEILERVGGPYNWHRRAEYHDPKKVKRITDILADAPSMRFSFWAKGPHGEEEIGGAIIANIEPNVPRIIDKAETRGYLNITHQESNQSIEIYKIGLFPEFTNKGWGKHILPKLLTEIFEDSNKPAVVYLNTRSTNHDGVIKFYRDLNMHVIHAEAYPNDLVPDEKMDSENRHSRSTARKVADKARTLIPDSSVPAGIKLARV